MGHARIGPSPAVPEKARHRPRELRYSFCVRALGVWQPVTFLVLITACGGSGADQVQSDDAGGENGGPSGARAALNGVLLDDDPTSPDNVSLVFGDLTQTPPIYIADGEEVDGFAYSVNCQLGQDQDGVSVAAALGVATRTRFSFDAVSIPDGGTGTQALTLVQPNNGVTLTSPPEAPCTFVIDPDDAPSDAAGSIRLELNCEEVSNAEYRIDFGLHATLDLAGCETDSF